MTEPIKYPALYYAANRLAKNSQEKYFRSIKVEYALLIAAATLALFPEGVGGCVVAYALVVLAALFLLLWRNVGKPDQDWYRSRALAESIKTSTWRYCMRAQPFEDAPDLRVRRAEFRNHLNNILEGNRLIGHKLPPERANEDQVTPEMESVRASALSERRNIYLEGRIKEQRNWYRDRAVTNKKAGRRWVTAGVCTYGLVILLILLRIGYPTWTIWPTEPLIVVATAIIGWTQIKKFNELVSAYTLTAFEIGIIQGKLVEAQTEDAFAEFVSESELAFSREHTQWSARQD